MDTKKLRQKILDLAIRGKLVPQDPNDEPASVLLERIRAEKEQLIKEGKIKRSKKSASADTSHYENVPNGWEICKLYDVCTFENGYAFKSSDYIKSGVPLIRISNIMDNAVSLNDCVYIQQAVDERFCVLTGDLLIALSGATTGKMGVYNDNQKAYLNQRVGNLRIISSKELLPEYRNLFMMSKVEKILAMAYGGAQPNISGSEILDFDFLLPPRNEQSRIVSEVNKLNKVIDSLELNKYDISNAVKQAKAKILGLAISGKLVPQDPSDEPAIELLNRINPDFKPADTSHYENLPKGWTRLGLYQIITLLSGRDLETRFCNDSKEGIPYLIGASNIDRDKFNITRWTNQPEVISVKGDILISCKGTVGKVIENNIGTIHIARQFMAIRNKGIINNDYLILYLNTIISQLQRSARGVIPGISRDDILYKEINIPPLKEQDRIVRELNNLFKCIDGITAEL